MGKGDTVIAAVGIGILVAAAVAILWTQEFAGLEDVRFESNTTALATMGPTTLEGPDLAFEWHGLPDNATAANVTVEVVFDGQAFAGGGAVIQAVLHAPDGQVRQTRTATLTIPAGGTDASTTLTLDVAWAAVPDDVRIQPDRLDATLTWDAPLVLALVVEPPNDLPLATYGFAASATGTVTHYSASY